MRPRRLTITFVYVLAVDLDARERSLVQEGGACQQRVEAV